MNNEPNAVTTLIPATPSRLSFALKYVLATVLGFLAYFLEFAHFPNSLFRSSYLTGLLLGATLGVSQWVVLRNHVSCLLKSMGSRNTLMGQRHIRELSIGIILCIVGSTILFVVLMNLRQPFACWTLGLVDINSSELEKLFCLHLTVLQLILTSILLGLLYSLPCIIYLRVRIPRMWIWAFYWIAHNVVGIAICIITLKNIDWRLPGYFNGMIMFLNVGFFFGTSQALFMYRIEPLFRAHLVDSITRIPTGAK